MYARSHLIDLLLFPASLVAALFLVAGCDSDSDVAVRRDCLRLRDHVIELRMATVTADRAQHRAALATSLGDGFITECATATSAVRLRCALAASDEESLAACERPRS